MAKLPGLLIPAKYFDEIRMLSPEDAGTLFHAFLDCVDDFLDNTDGLNSEDDFFEFVSESEADAHELSPMAAVIYRLCSQEICSNLATYRARQSGSESRYR